MISFQVFGIETIHRGADRVNRAAQSFRGSPRVVIRETGEMLFEAIKEVIPVASEDENWGAHDREHARDRIEFHASDDEGTFDGPEYLQYVIKGSEEYTLYPVNGQALSFFVGATSVAVGSVDIPARSPDDFRQRAINDSRHDILEHLRVIGRKILHGESEID